MDINPKFKKGILVALAGTITAASFLFDGFLAGKGRDVNSLIRNQQSIAQTTEKATKGEQFVNIILTNISDVQKELNFAKKAIEDNNPDKALNHLVKAEAHLWLLQKAGVDIRELLERFLSIKQQLLSLQNQQKSN